MKIGDLVAWALSVPRSRRKMGIIIEFDEDNDPIVHWFESNYREPNYRRHIVVISKEKH